MEERKRTILAIIIACAVLLAVLYSFSLNLFSPRQALVLANPTVTADVAQSSSDPNAGGVPVEVTPQTVQLLVADLERYESYSRTVAVLYRWGESDSGTVTAQVWAEDGWTRTDALLPSGMTEHSIVGGGQMWLWYDGDDQIYTGPAGEMTADLMQRLPTYENVLALDAEDITAAGYEERMGQPCVYVEARKPELGYLYRYWVSVNNGLLMASETEKDGVVVYAMASYEVVSPLVGSDSLFVLPDGTRPKI